ncbi:MAG: sulfotransferase [Gemmatimonadales bacterium]
MPSIFRRALHRFLPSHFHDPVGLAVRLVRSRDVNAWYAMLSAGMGVVLTPLDLLLQPAERRRYRAAGPPALPSLFVCGPPRSGTSVTYQVLAANLPVAYFMNLSGLFPRSPVTARRLFGRLLPRWRVSYQSYYGRTRNLTGPNDALHLWDRWLGKDRTSIPDHLTPAALDDMRRFFGAMEALAGRPLVAKNNNMNAFAHLVAEALPRASFLCLHRDPAWLAQALYLARLDIHGDHSVPYGLAQPAEGAAVDPIEDVCRQVAFHARLMEDQRRRIPDGRFRALAYEEFCLDPVRAVHDAASALGVEPDPSVRALKPFVASARVRMDPAMFTRMVARLAELGLTSEASA